MPVFSRFGPRRLRLDDALKGGYANDAWSRSSSYVHVHQAWRIPHDVLALAAAEDRIPAGAVRHYAARHPHALHQLAAETLLAPQPFAEMGTTPAGTQPQRRRRQGARHA